MSATRSIRSMAMLHGLTAAGIRESRMPAPPTHLERPNGIRLADRGDFRATGHLHERWLHSGFFPRLGLRFLAAYHASFHASPSAVVLVVEHRGQPEAFLAGTLDNEEHYRWVSRHRFVPLALLGGWSLVRDRALLREFLRTRLGRYARALRRRLRRTADGDARHRPGDAPSADAARVAVLTHVAVAPQLRGTGIGRRLVDAFLEAAREAGAAEARLISPATTEASGFYRALGWQSAGERHGADGTLVEEFRLPL